ncbi:type II secretion system protein GspG [Roseateles aquatilis]|uniref:Type II secretion system core protein G n=1 Tax=Roseateles aquatilis TaxID=431061 RepID=A0A246J3H7_9BURK|nr:type II secretion system major pseudopilin GspG [Roseateles aquatilis]OWQ87002.1 type II secretion system protein GspG [Roseateles aquatilis]
MKHSQHLPARPVGRTHALAARGFTLLELLVVILIIGLLTGIVGPRFLSQISRSEVTTARAQLDAIDKALQAFRIDMGRYPETGEGLAALVRSDANDPRWRGPYLKGDLPNDPWGMPYQYRVPSQQPGKDYDLLSFGRDRVQGGTGDDADIQL